MTSSASIGIYSALKGSASLELSELSLRCSFHIELSKWNSTTSSSNVTQRIRLVLSAVVLSSGSLPISHWSTGKTDIGDPQSAASIRLPENDSQVYLVLGRYCLSFCPYCCLSGRRPICNLHVHHNDHPVNPTSSLWYSRDFPFPGFALRVARLLDIPSTCGLLVDILYSKLLGKSLWSYFYGCSCFNRAQIGQGCRRHQRC